MRYEDKKYDDDYAKDLIKKKFLAKEVEKIGKGIIFNSVFYPNVKPENVKVDIIDYDYFRADEYFLTTKNSKLIVEGVLVAYIEDDLKKVYGRQGYYIIVNNSSAETLAQTKKIKIQE